MNALIRQKSQELSFALLRVAAHIRRYELRRNLERLTYHLLENVSYQNPEIALSSIEAIRNFVLLGKNIYEIEAVNAKILNRELEQLSNEIHRFEGTTALPDLESMFTKKIEIKPEPKEVIIPEEEMPNPAIESGNQEMDNAEYGNTEIRKGKIFAMLATAPEKRLSLKEIVAAFPEVSDRTIRYDLKRLFEQGKVIRQGSGGPSNYYMVK